MRAEYSVGLLRFARLKERDVVADFCGGTIALDAEP